MRVICWGFSFGGCACFRDMWSLLCCEQRGHWLVSIVGRIHKTCRGCGLSGNMHSWRTCGLERKLLFRSGDFTGFFPRRGLQ
ncbi:hypothetical protein B0H12DRAFT_1145119 [Mycena haematopus]|nr:hypothetical protein B0H12DRAFT_1145119 [Mycena haematopus]